MTSTVLYLLTAWCGVNILAFAIVENSRRHMENGDVLLMRFDVEIDGVEMNHISLVRKSSGLVVRFPGRVRGSSHLAAKTALARVAFATFVQAGGVEEIPLDEVA